MTDWQRGSPQDPSPLEGALGGEAVSFRAESPGFGDLLPLAEGGGKCGTQLLRRPCHGEEARVSALGEEEGVLLPSWASEGRRVRTVGTEARLRSLSRRQMPLNLQAYSFFLTKAKRALGRK